MCYRIFGIKKRIYDDMIQRSQYLQLIKEVFNIHSVCALLGARQCGKTTLARLYAEEVYKNEAEVHYFDLEHPRDLNSLSSPALTLEPLRGCGQNASETALSGFL